MTVAQKRSTTSKFENNFLSSLQKQFPDLIPPAIALAIFPLLLGQHYQDQFKLFKTLGS
jgi:hypothetical protein